MSDLLKNYSSRIKSIYLELKDYSYYHNPSEINNPDKRFIGRKEMKKKLRNLLTRSKTNSGTYLVTGFRGMGKTSFVNQVLSEILDTSTVLEFTKFLFRFSIWAWIASFINSLYVITFSSIIIFLLVNVIVTGEKKFTNTNKNNKIFRYFKDSFIVFYTTLSNPLDNTESLNNKKLFLAKNLIRIGTLLFISNFLIILIEYDFFFNNNNSNTDWYHVKFFSYFGILGFYLLIFAPIKYSIIHSAKKLSLLSLTIYLSFASTIFLIGNYILRQNAIFLIIFILLSFILFYFKDNLKKIIHSYLNYSEIIPIKINLGKEQLSEEDILRLIAFSLLDKYKRIVKYFGYFKRTLWTIATGLLIYFIGYSLFFNKPTYSLIERWKQESKLYEYFPSQRFIFVSKFDTIAKKLDLLKKDDFFNNYSKIFFKEESINTKDNNFNKRFIQDSFNITSDIHQLKELINFIKKEDPGIEFNKISIIQSFKNNEISFDSLFIDIATPLDSIVKDSLYAKYSIVLNKKKVNKALNHITFTLDYLYISTYINLAKPFQKLESSSDKSPKGLLSNTLNLKQNISLFPFRDYFFLIFIIIFAFIARWILSWRLWGMNHKIVYSQLNDLSDSINAKVNESKSRHFGLGVTKLIQSLSFSRSRTRSKEFPIAGAREIEMSIISILADIESITPWRMRPRFVFVFDELDKIQPKDVGDDEPNEFKEYAETEWVKRRQDTIRKILTNLKHFFNTAKAKFIFIAGREMYDAALADISDRDALIGSMFHHILYVHSFYKDPADERLSDITSMTEKYICKFLISEKYIIKNLSGKKDPEIDLRVYGKYLKSEYPKLNNSEIVKIILTLHDFISYVSYRSNGAPKKITGIFEDYITSFPNEKKSKPKETEADFISTIITRGDERSLYLHFSYKDQYIFTVGRYLFNPFVIAVNKYISDFEDKLLVSTSFLLNHLYKFHKVGFSYRTLELTPEIIAIYKAPELRDFIKRLIVFLNNTHLRKIISGIYDFKFHSKLENEIAFVSKISEKESAALNFTLDESLMIKSIFRSQVKKLKLHWKAKHELKNNIDSLALLNANLGDLSFNDNQFNEAIFYYNEVLIPYKNMDINKMDPDSIISYIRTSLMLGLSFEMIKNMDKALLIYENIYHKSLFFVENCAKRKEWNKNEIPRQNAPLLTIQRLFYQSLIAKLYVIEKSTIKSLTKNQVYSNKKSFKKIVYKFLEPEQHFLLKSEYYNKIGDLLYYKNGILFGKPENEQNQKDHFKHFINIQKNKKHKRHLYALPTSGYEYYMMSLASLINIGIDEKFNSRTDYFKIESPEESEILILHYFTDFLFRGAQKEFPLTRRSFYLAAANSLSDAGDSILTFSTAQINNEQERGSEKFNNIFDIDILSNVFSFTLNDILNDKDQNKYHIKNIYKLIVKEKRIINEEIIKEIEELIEKFKTSKKKIKNKKFTEIIKKVIKQLSKINKDSNWKNLCEIWNNNDETKLEFDRKYEIYLNEKTRIQNELIRKGYRIKLNNLRKEIKHIHDIDYLFKEGNKILANDRIEKVRDIIVNKYRKDLKFNRFHISLRYIFTSAVYYLKGGDYKEYVFQMTKFLQIFRIMLPVIGVKKDNQEILLNLIKTKIVTKAIRYVFKSYKNYNKTEEYKLLNSIDFDISEIENKVIHRSTSAAEDIKEIVILSKEIELILSVDKKLKIQNSGITPYITVSLEGNRLHELNYKNHFNFKVLNQLVDNNINIESLIKTNALYASDADIIIKYILNDTDIDDRFFQLEFVIIDSLFSLFKMHKSVEIFGLSYTHNHSWYASIYKRIGYWSQLYQAFIKETNDIEKTSKKLEKLIGKVEINDLRPLTYYEKALTHTYSIISSHFEGNEYYNIIGEMNYLDDDFNDAQDHFSATIERVVINLGIIDKNIIALNELIKKESIITKDDNLINNSNKKEEKFHDYHVNYYM